MASMETGGEAYDRPRSRRCPSADIRLRPGFRAKEPRPGVDIHHLVKQQERENLTKVFFHPETLKELLKAGRWRHGYPDKLKITSLVRQAARCSDQPGLGFYKTRLLDKWDPEMVKIQDKDWMTFGVLLRHPMLNCTEFQEAEVVGSVIMQMDRKRADYGKPPMFLWYDLSLDGQTVLKYDNYLQADYRELFIEVKNPTEWGYADGRGRRLDSLTLLSKEDADIKSARLEPGVEGSYLFLISR